MFKNRKIVIVSLALILILGCMGICAVISVNHYFDRNTWATIWVCSEMHSDTADVFVDEREYLKGDRIVIGTVVLEVTDIKHDGTVSFSVKQGNLYDEEGNEIRTGTLSRSEKRYYKIENGQVSLSVTANRYR